MSLEQLRKRIRELKEKGLLGSGYTAPEWPGMGEPYQPMNQNPVNNSRNEVDNTEKLGYTPVKTTGNSNAGIASTNVYVPNMGAAPNADIAGSNNTRNNSTSGNKEIVPYQISDSEKELNYMMDMLFMNGAGSSSIPSVQMAYEWVSNPDNKGKEIPQDVLDTYYAFLGGVDDKQIARSNQIAVGKEDEIGLVGKIYEAKAANQQTTEDSKSISTYYPAAKNTSPVSTSLPDFAKSTGDTKQSSNETVTLGKAGQNALGEIIKPNPDFFGTRSGYLYEAYQAGLNGIDFSKELKDDAAAGNFLDEIEKMYKAGETDAKIAADSEVPKMGEDSGVQGKAANTQQNTGNQPSAAPQPPETDTPIIDPSMGKAGNKVLGEVRDSDPETFFKKNDALAEAYQAGFYRMDLTQEMLNDADRDFKKVLERINSAGKIDSRTDDGDKVLEERDKGLVLLTATNDFYKTVLSSLGAGNSQDVNVQKAYQTAYDYFNNSVNIGKVIPEDVKSALNTFFQSVDSDTKAGILKGMGLEGLTNKVELSDGSYSKTEQNIIPTGPYAGRTVNQGFNDPTTNYQGHMGYDIGGEYGSDIVPILDGKVAYFTEDDSTLNGWMVVIEHELPDGTKYYSSYSHLEKHAENLYVGMKVSTDTVIGSMGGSSGGNPHGVGTHLHLMVYTRVKPYETPYILDPHGYASKVKKEGTKYNKYNFEDAGCTYNQYYCITPNYKGDINDYHFIVFYDPLVVMLTNGGIISLFPYEYIKKG